MVEPKQRQQQATERRRKQNQIQTFANPAEVLHLFAKVQERLYQGDTVKKALVQISKCTQDEKILETCAAISTLLNLEFTESFVSSDRRQYFDAVQKLQRHLAWVLEKYNQLPNLIEQSDPKWTAALYRVTQTQIATMIQLIALLDNEPALCDRQGNPIYPNDLVVVPCQDEQGREYEHFGIVRSTPNGYRIAHFFTGETVCLHNRIVQMGVGYIHFTSDLTAWQFKERPENVIDADIEERIAKFQAEIRNGQSKLWNQLNYNCEHWAREMVYGKAASKQVQNRRNKNQT